MSRAESFLAHIRENLDDDAVRLVFADWLEDHNDPDRAEFVRLQVRLAQLPEHDPARFDLEERSQELLAEHQARWLAPLPKWARAVELAFRRGLPEEAKMTSAAWLRHGARLAQLVPLQRLHLAANSRLADMARLVSEVGLGELECLFFSENTNSVAAFFGGLKQARLRRLVVNSSRKAALVAPLLAWPGLGRLTGLRIRDFSCELLPLLASLALGPLEWLDLGQTRNGPAEWTALAANDQLLGLRHLELGDLDTGGRGVGRALADARWSRLEDFRLMALHTSADDLSELLAARWAGSARWNSTLKRIDIRQPGTMESPAAVPRKPHPHEPLGPADVAGRPVCFRPGPRPRLANASRQQA